MHSCFSISDAIGYPKDIINYVMKNGMNTTALTDHGNMNSMADFYLSAKKINGQGGNKFKPIYGVEAYFHPSLRQWKDDYEQHKEDKKNKKKDASTQIVENETESKIIVDPKSLRRRHHLVLLAQNEEGLKNLYKLVYHGNKKGYYYFPRIDLEALRHHSNGLVATSACVDGKAILYTSVGVMLLKDLVSRCKKEDIYVLSYNENEKRVQFQRCMNGMLTKKSKTYKIKIKNGKEIKVTGDHKIYTNSGWKCVDKLLSTDKILSI